MKKILFLLVSVCFILSCSKDDSIKVDKDADLSKEITMRSGMLVFPDDDVFAQVMARKLEIPAHLNFVSQNDIFNQITLAEEIHASKIADTNTENAELLHSNLYNERLKSGFIKIEKFSDGAELYDLNLSLPHYSHILNEEGFYAIGNNIYQITSETDKAWINGDFSNYALLAKACATNSTEGIYVREAQKDLIETRLTPFQSSNLNLTIKHGYTGSNYRYYVKTYDKTQLNFPPVSYKRETYIRVVAQKKSGNSWVYYTDFANDFWFRFIIVDGDGNFVTTAVIHNQNSTGSNIYYNMYCHPDWLSINEVSSHAGLIEYTNDYVYIGNFQFELTGKKESDNCYMNCECYYNGYGSNKWWKLGYGLSCETVTDVGL